MANDDDSYADHGMPSSWNDSFDAILKWTIATDNASPPLKIGHIEGLRAYGPSTSIPIRLWLDVTHRDPSQLFIFVSNDVEAGRAAVRACEIPIYEEPQPDMTEPTFMTYHGLIHILKSNRCHAEGGWEAATLDGWDRLVLPHKVIFFIDVDPFFRADFALSIILLARWVSDRVSTESRSSIRILTASAEMPLERLSSLLCHYNPTCRVDTFILPSPTNIPRTKQAAFENLRLLARSAPKHRLSLRLADEIAQSPAEVKHIVITFYGNEEITDELVDQLILLDADCEFFYVQTGDLRAIHEETRFTFANRKHLQAKVQEIVMPFGCIPEVLLPDNYQTHILCGPARCTSLWDRRYANILEGPLHASIEDIYDQASWKFRVSPHARYEPVVHVDEGLLYSMQYGTIHTPRRILHVENQHQAGFLCALSEFAEGWDIDTAHAARCFIRIEYELFETTRRLSTQGLMPKGWAHPDTPAGTLRCCLPQSQRRLFFEMLSLVDYNYSLAMFLAMPSATESVARIKVQLAALLTIGCMNVFDLESLEEIPHPDKDILAGLKAECRGYTFPISHKGSWWVLIGIWESLYSDKMALWAASITPGG